MSLQNQDLPTQLVRILFFFAVIGSLSFWDRMYSWI